MKPWRTLLGRFSSVESANAQTDGRVLGGHIVCRKFYCGASISDARVREQNAGGPIEHEVREKSGPWKFMRWDVVDLSQLKVKLKAEFQGNNRDLYRPEAIVASSAK